MKNALFVIAVSVLLVDIIIIVSRVVSRGGRVSNTVNRGNLISLVSFAITLLGIAIAIADSYLSQYDYDICKTAYKYERMAKDGISFDSIIETQPGTPPYYFFVRDLSGSMKNNSFHVDSLLVGRMIDSVSCYVSNYHGSQESGDSIILFLDKVKKELRKTKPNKRFLNRSDYLQLYLMYSIARLGNMNEIYPDNGIDFSIISFGNKVESFKPQCGGTLDSRIIESLRYIAATSKYNNGFTRFVPLFEKLSHEITLSVKAPLRHQNKKKDVVIYFFTDYINDDEECNKLERTRLLKEQLRTIENSSVNLKLYVWDNDKYEIGEIKKDQKLTDVRELLRMCIDTSSFEELDVRVFQEEIDYPVTVKQPFPFFYKNSVFEESLKTNLIFTYGGEYGFCLDKYSNSRKQEYRLCHKKYTDKSIDTLRLSTSPNVFHVCMNDTIEIEICGYIPSPYECPDLIIKDNFRRVEYIIPVVFFKKFPKSAFGLLIVFLFTLIVIFDLLVPGGNCRNH